MSGPTVAETAPSWTGPADAETMGYEGPFRDPDAVRAQRLEAEKITAPILGPVHAVLSPAERADFGELVETTRNAIHM